MDDRRSFLKNTAVFGGLVLSPLGLYWPLESPVGGDIIKGGLGQPPPYHPEALAKAIIEDFEGGRLVTYQGWVMAELEAQLMAALAASGPSVS